MNKIQCNHTFVLMLLGFVMSLAYWPQPGLAQSRESLRYEIDAKRGGMSYTSKDALPRGREFKRLDSSYYVGWMFEGSYKFDHAADVLGFKMASDQLHKAITLLEKDFKKEVYTRTSDVFEYIKIMKYQRDFDYIAYALTQCYSNTEEVDKLWKLLLKCRKVNLQLEAYSDTYNYMAWTVHRNRFYTGDKYAFLRNTIDKNEQYANKLLDSGITKLRKDAELNKSIFTANYENEKIPGVWHYKSILYSYQLNIESGAHYYEKLKSTPYFPQNNFATFCMIQGKFRESEKYYQLAKEDEPGDKRMKESYYYSSVLNTYKNENEKGIDELKSLIKANGSTPGFGWYNIALARNLIYNGQIEIAKRYAKRAEQFKEIHIGTTLGQSHYDFSVSLMNLIIKNREIESIKFLNKNWWYTPSDLQKLTQLIVENYSLQFLIINQFASNPERDRVVYKLFSTESTVSFDEVWQLLDGFSVNYFLEKYKTEINKDQRPIIKRYYKLFVGKLLMKKGKHNEALNILNSAYTDPQIDQEYEKLFKARCLEAIIQCKLKENGNANCDPQCAELYSLYPQLVPFSGIAPSMKLVMQSKSPIQLNIKKKLDNLNVKWVQTQTQALPIAKVDFTIKEGTQLFKLTVEKNGEPIRSFESTYKNENDAFQQIAFGLFGIGNDDKSIQKK